MPRTGRPQDRELLSALEALGTEPFDGIVWRTGWATRMPTVGSATAGRWHPEGAFEALYTSLTEDGALAEVYYHLSRAPIFSSRPMRLHRFAVKTRRTLRLPGMEALARLGIEEAKFRSMEFTRSQEIGAAAYLLDCDAMLVPSARWPCLNLVLFLDRLDGGAAIDVLDSTEVNWPAWREQRASSVEF